MYFTLQCCKKGPTRPLFVYCLSFHMTNLTINDKSVDDVLGIRTQGSRIVGIDNSTELCGRPHYSAMFGLEQLGIVYSATAVGRRHASWHKY